jgi:2-C-methyl-D-erythritol 4-phosphate cytidylyltransferase
MKISIAVIICAAGTSKRMNGAKKEYLPLPGNKTMTVLGAAVSAFASCPQITSIAITIPPESSEEAKASLPAGLRDKVIFVNGGTTRRASVHNALARLEQHNPTHILIHDGARPWIKPDLIERVMDAAISCDAVIPALPLTETPKELFKPTAESPSAVYIKRHLKRNNVWAAQTPQGFVFSKILEAHEKAREKEEREDFEYTDDAEIWGEFIGQVAVIPGDPENKKITYPEDLILNKFQEEHS